jgi:hypothetical protein
LSAASESTTRIEVSAKVGRRGRSDRSRGHGPNHNVANSKREKTAKFESSRDARTVDPESAAVRGRVDGADEVASVAGDCAGTIVLLFTSGEAGPLLRRL